MSFKRKIKITKIQEENIKKEYFEKIEKRRLDVNLYKKCYYTNRLDIKTLSKEERDLRKTINSGIWFMIKYRYDDEFRERVGRQKKERRLGGKIDNQKEGEYYILPNYAKNEMVKRKKLPEEKILNYLDIQKKLMNKQW
jgi:hypothetical protein